MNFINWIISILIFVSAQSTLAMDSKVHIDELDTAGRLQCFKKIMLDEQLTEQKNNLFDLCKKHEVLECFFFLKAYFVNQEKIEHQYHTLINTLSSSGEDKRLYVLNELIVQKSIISSGLLEVISLVWMQPDYDPFSPSEKPRVNTSDSLHKELNQAFLKIDSFNVFEDILRRIVDDVIKMLNSNNVDPYDLINLSPRKASKEKCIVS